MRMMISPRALRIPRFSPVEAIFSGLSKTRMDANLLSNSSRTSRVPSSLMPLAMRTSVEKKSGANILKYGSEKQKETPQTQFKPDCQVGIVRAAYASHQIQISQFLPKSLANERVFLNGPKCHLPPIKPVTETFSC